MIDAIRTIETGVNRFDPKELARSLETLVVRSPVELQIDDQIVERLVPNHIQNEIKNLPGFHFSQTSASAQFDHVSELLTRALLIETNKIDPNKLKPSEDWQQLRLEAAGIPSGDMRNYTRLRTFKFFGQVKDKVISYIGGNNFGKQG